MYFSGQNLFSRWNSISWGKGKGLHKHRDHTYMTSKERGEGGSTKFEMYRDGGEERVCANLDVHCKFFLVA